MKTKIIRRAVLFAFMLFASASLLASNVQITKGPAISKNLASNEIKVKFDLSWDYSWNLANPGNHDAVWVFVKYRVEAGNWRHAYLKSTAKNSVIGTGSTPTVDSLTIEYGKSKLSDGTDVNAGAFIFRNKESHGRNDLKDVTLDWDITNLGIENNTVISIRVFAIEMVYVPEGAFKIGDDISFRRLASWGDTLFDTKYGPLTNGTSAADRFPENIIPVMTAANAPAGYTCASSGNYSASYPQWYAFNSNLGNCWYTPSATRWDWLEISFPEAKRPTWGIFNVHNGGAGYTTRGFYVMGSNDDGATWSMIHGNDAYLDPVNMTYNPSSYSFMFDHLSNTPVVFENPGSYKTIRFYFYNQYNVVYNIQLFESGEDRVNTILNENAKYIPTTNAVNQTAFSEIPVEFPKGYKPFYVMKHELTQAAYVDYLNTLAYDQQKQHLTMTPESAIGTVYYAAASRARIRIKERGIDGPAVLGISTDGIAWDNEDAGGNVPMFNMAWTDITAYLDWAALRPLTELEYEKMSRGGLSQPRVQYEYAWGRPYLSTRVASVLNKDQRDEDPQPATANYCQAEGGTISAHTATQNYWPVRAGSFARSESTREDAGATYYGILNVSDNVPERFINVSTDQGRAFTGEHGDGNIDARGYSNVSGWPAQTATVGATGNAIPGVGFKGVAVSTTTIYHIMPVSNRQFIDYTANPGSCLNTRDLWTGCRGGRTAPSAM